MPSPLRSPVLSLSLLLSILSLCRHHPYLAELNPSLTSLPAPLTLVLPCTLGQSAPLVAYFVDYAYTYGLADAVSAPYLLGATSNAEVFQHFYTCNSTGLGGAVVSGFSYVTIRRLRGREHPLVIVFWFPLIALPLGLIGTALTGLWPTPAEWGWLLLTGLFTQAAQVTMTRAYQAEEVSKVAALNYIGLLYAVGIGWAVFGERLGLITLAGLALVLVGAVANVALKNRHDQQAAAALAAEVEVTETV